MRLGVTSYAFTWAIGVPGYVFPVAGPDAARMDSVGLLDRASALGVGVVQYLDNVALHALAAAELDAIDRRAGELGLALEVGTRGIEPGHLRRYLELAIRFGSPLVRLVVDTADRHPSAAEVVEALRPLMTDFERAGVSLAIENHDRFSAATLIDVLDAVASDRLGICLDTVNSFGALEGPDRVVETLGPRSISLHIKDFAIRRVSHAMGFVVEGEPAGRGRLDVPWLLGSLRRTAPDMNALLELWTPPEPSLTATVAKEDRWAVESIEYLRTLIPG
jgi:sugar phosphate isomerase/epimerase